MLLITLISYTPRYHKYPFRSTKTHANTRTYLSIECQIHFRGVWYQNGFEFRHNNNKVCVFWHWKNTFQTSCSRKSLKCLTNDIYSSAIYRTNTQQHHFHLSIQCELNVQIQIDFTFRLIQYNLYTYDTNRSICFMLLSLSPPPPSLVGFCASNRVCH